MGVGLSGVALLAFRGGVELRSAAGVVLVLSPVTWSFGSLLGRKIDVARGMAGAGTQMVGGGALMFVVSRLLGEPWPWPVSTRVLLVFAYLVVVGSYVGFSAYAYLLENTRPSLAMSYAYVNPVVAIVLGATLGHERVDGVTILAALLVTGGVLVLTMKRTPNGA
ncbi:MAG: EamA family transporter [Polyangiaceae bacterium]